MCLADHQLTILNTLNSLSRAWQTMVYWMSSSRPFIQIDYIYKNNSECLYKCAWQTTSRPFSILSTLSRVPGRPWSTGCPLADHSFK